MTIGSTPEAPWQLRLYDKSLKKKLTVRALLKHLPDVAGKRCLEIGCATGVTSHFLRERDGWWTSGDFDREQIRSASGLVSRTVHLGRTALPFADASFDVVCGINFLEHLDDDAHWVREMARVTRPGGELLFVAPSGEKNRPAFLGKRLLGLTAARAGLGHVRDGYPPDVARRLFEANGWQVLYMADYCRLFSEVLEDALNWAFRKKAASGAKGTQSFHGDTAPTSSGSLERVGPAYRAYARVYPLLRAWASLDALIPFSRGYMTVVRARK
ncbi:MAG: class I SAM-dependent methyltransferase [bacterium]